MSYEVIQTVGKYKYIYLAEGFRNEEGKPRQKRRPIGKIDPKTGKKVYKPEYLEELRNAGIHLDIAATDETFSKDDIIKSDVRSYGLFLLYRSIAERIGLTDVLESAFPNYWKELFMLACYMISTGDPLMYCSDWLTTTDSYKVGSMSSQRISELLVCMKPEQRSIFYSAWYLAHQENEYLALDITSESSYSELIEDVEWGYNRDHENLPQVNLCMLMGETSRLPIYQDIYSGSLKDVRTLITTISRFEAVSGTRAVTLVMDKGFFSRKNVDFLLGGDNTESVDFLISVPFTSSFAKQQVSSERKDIDCVENTIVVDGYSMRAVTKERSWDKGHRLFTHIYYSARKASGIREELYAHVAVLREQAEESPEKAMADTECRKYLIIRHSGKQASGYTINIRKDAVEEALGTAGWIVLISNKVPDARQAMRIYRDKDVVEKGFLRLKNSIDLGRLRVHGDGAMQGKQFIGFIAGILMSEINRIMSENNLYKKYTMKELLSTVAKQRVQEIRGQRIIYPATREQKTIYDAFGIQSL